MSTNEGKDLFDPSDYGGGGTIVPWSCPDCAGSLWRTVTGRVIQFRCRVGHVYSAEGYLEEQAGTIERTLWSVIRLMEERAAFGEYLAEHAELHGQWREAEVFRKRAAQNLKSAAELRRVMEVGDGAYGSYESRETGLP